MRAATRHARTLLNRIAQTRAVNKAMNTALSPLEVERLPLDLVEAALALVTPDE